MATRELGIDDAGRGPVMGPMILGGCLIKKSDEQELKELGVRDSKTLTPKRRAFLAEKIKEKVVSYKLIKIFPDEIDSQKDAGVKLNEVEAIAAAEIIDALNDSDEKLDVVLDCPSVNTVAWKDFLVSKLKKTNNLEIESKHKADATNISVGAASILAKEEREKEVAKIKEEYGDVGSGYPGDPKTIVFLRENAIKLKDKGVFRKSWSTYQKYGGKVNQKTLF
ncbi:ribonuclease HII [Candidatus Pacearchaeota archaeon]|nr:ribonuclease HII [Candidatus Pacearchaeota archaeon]